MQRYTQGSILIAKVDEGMHSKMEFSVDGEWVKYSDAESAIVAARKQGAEEALQEVTAYCEWSAQGAMLGTLPSPERAEGYRRVAQHIKARGAEPCDMHPSDGTCKICKPPEPAPLEKVNLHLHTGLEASVEIEAILNALIDHVNRIEARGRP